MKPETKGPDANAELREKLEAEFREKFAAIADELMKNPNCAAWLKLSSVLKKASMDKEILSSRGASEFLEIVRMVVDDSFTCDDSIQAFRLLIPLLAGDQFRDNGGRIKGGDTMRRRKEAHVGDLRAAVTDILKNPTTADWSDPEIARWLMKPERAYHVRKGKTPLGLRTMTTRVKEIRADYKASI